MAIFSLGVELLEGVVDLGFDMLPPCEAFIWEGIGTQQIFEQGRRSPILTARRKLYIVSPQAFAMLYAAVPRSDQIPTGLVVTNFVWQF